MKKRTEDLKIVKRRRLSPDYFYIELESNEKIDGINPGQFAQLSVKYSKNTFLRRPFSISEVNYEKDSISFLIKIVGDGTRALSYLEEGDYISTIFPLGNSFSISSEIASPLLIGGGIGTAPLYFLAKEMNKQGVHPDILIGAQNKNSLVLIDELEKIGKVYISTDDGSRGEKGLVIENSLVDKLSNYDKIYSCGPDLMMKAVSKLAHKAKTECEVSLENLMACGIGACLCCIEKTKKGNICVCTEGPVFNINDLLWQI